MNIKDIIIKQYLLFNPNTNSSITDYNINFIIENSIIIYSVIDIDIDIIKLINNTYSKPIKWIYNEKNVRIPYPYIPYYKLTDNDNIYDFISSLISIIPMNELISGERIQNLADVVIGDIVSLNYNPNNKRFSKIMLNMNEQNIENTLQKYDRFFLFTHLLPKFNALKLYEKIKGKILITHNSDDNAENYSNIVLRQFSQNARNITENNEYKSIVGLPIGIENEQWFNYSLLENNILSSPQFKTKNVYFYFSIKTHSSRAICRDILIKKHGLEWNIKRTKYDYFQELARHKYCICPRGNGVDTHRVWECLYLNVIPIIIRADYIDAFVGLPIIVLDNWDDFNIKILSNTPIFENQQISKLTMNYWKKYIEMS